MAGMSVEEFEEEVISVCSGSPAVRNITGHSLGLDWCSVRTFLVDESVVDIFYN